MGSQATERISYMSVEFRAFLDTIERNVPHELDVHGDGKLRHAQDPTARPLPSHSKADRAAHSSAAPNISLRMLPFNFLACPLPSGRRERAATLKPVRAAKSPRQSWRLPAILDEDSSQCESIRVVPSPWRSGVYPLLHGSVPDRASFCGTCGQGLRALGTLRFEAPSQHQRPCRGAIERSRRRRLRLT